MNNNDEGIVAKRVVEQFFEWYQEKESEKMKSLFWENNPGADDYSWQFDAIDTIRLLQMEKQTKEFTDNYLDESENNILLNASEIAIFQVKYEVTNKDGATSIYEEGEHFWWFILIKDQQASPWNIYTIGTAL